MQVWMLITGWAMIIYWVDFMIKNKLGEKRNGHQCDNKPYHNK